MIQTAAQKRRFKIQHAVLQSVFGARAAIMNFIGMQDNDIARIAGTKFPAIVKGLNTLHGDAQRIGVMAVRAEHIAIKPGFDPLDPVAGRGGDKALMLFAQTFNTGIGALIYCFFHHLIIRPVGERICLTPKSRWSCAMILKPGNR